MELKLPSAVRQIIEVLENAGFEAYAVGGCVRDLMLGRTPQDYDITTNAVPGQVKALFRHTVDTGIEHGTVTVLLRGTGYEVTTYRVDGPYKDARHPSEVTFSAHLREDLQRRDFTINAMAYHPGRGLVDLFGGRDDLAGGIVRCVGTACERFGEDALRVLRAYRFAAQLSFSIEASTREAARVHAQSLALISAERIREEMTKLLISPHPEMIRALYEDGVTAVILPEFDRCMASETVLRETACSAGEHTIRVLAASVPDKTVRWAVLLGEMGEDAAADILARLKFDNRTSRDVVRLVHFHGCCPDAEESAVRQAAYEVGPGLFPSFLQILAAEAEADDPSGVFGLRKQIAQTQEIYRVVLERKDPLSVKELEINGNDLIAAGIAPGPDLGAALERAMRAVLEDPARNDKETLLRYIRK